MTQKQKKEIKEIANTLKLLDEKDLAIIGAGVRILKARQEIEKK